MNSNCTDLREQISILIDGDLPDSDSKALRQHLDACDPCRREEQLLRATVSAVASLPPVGVPDTFRQEIQGRIRTEAILVRTRQTYRRAIGIAATVALVCGLGLGLGLGGMYGPSGTDSASNLSDGSSPEAPFRGVPSGPNRTVSRSQSAAVTPGARFATPRGQSARYGTTQAPVYLGSTESSTIPRDYYLEPAQGSKEESKKELPAVVRVSF